MKKSFLQFWQFLFSEFCIYFLIPLIRANKGYKELNYFFTIAGLTIDYLGTVSGIGSLKFIWATCFAMGMHGEIFINAVFRNGASALTLAFPKISWITTAKPFVKSAWKTFMGNRQIHFSVKFQFCRMDAERSG